MIYVDNLRPCIPNNNWKHKESCHLFADNLDELCDFAKNIGLRKSWLQKGRLDHFDLTKNKRSVAVFYGAKEVNTKFMISKMHKHGKEY